MQTNAVKLRNQAAGPVLERVRADSERVSEKLKPLLDTIAVSLFDPELDLTSLCQDSGLSKSLVARHFTRELGISPWAYVINCRMRIGAELLLGTSLKIYKIGEVLGYPSSRDTFSDVFERWSGQSPTKYRKTDSDQADGDQADGDQADGDQAGDESGQIEPDGETIYTAKIQALAADLGLTYHERGARRTWSGDVERAYADLSMARRCYAAAGELPPWIRRQQRYIPVAFNTDEALLSALCPECRASLVSDQGRGVREHLRRALLPAPPDLPWFEVCCDECHQVVRQAIDRARTHHMDNAWRAWWLFVNADPEDRASGKVYPTPNKSFRKENIS